LKDRARAFVALRFAAGCGCVSAALAPSALSATDRQASENTFLIVMFVIVAVIPKDV
jgi:hypothetical protein